MVRGTEILHDTRTDPTFGIIVAKETLEALGTVSERTCMGNGSRRLQPSW